MDYKELDEDLIVSAVAVSSKSIGKGRAELDDSEVRSLEALVSETLKAHKYL